MKAKDLRALSPDELRTKIKDLREELFRIKFQHSTRQLENTARFSLLKSDIARVETIIREK
ncbi:MAG: 50S ribosomal protein L29 [Deltaproteobacteria bacterium]|jgi:large subunit ribosomal protein L29|nr:50S ribosomal protein L29 [Deltaproteobacteria bacterium]MDP2993046.1 50S ribosomal protein L29 [Deltaproteobacteria bacterium]MDP3028962.1 50S ribosomal protein L29 [Deltaproteobacteria bacterium]